MTTMTTGTCVIFLVIVVLLTVTSGVELPHIPCPRYFEYKYSTTKEGYDGELHIPYDGSLLLVLNVNMTVEAKLETDSEFKIELLSEKEDFVNGENIRYKITFPDKKPIPSLAVVELNGNVICKSDVNLSSQWVSVMMAKTTVELTREIVDDVTGTIGVEIENGKPTQSSAPPIKFKPFSPPNKVRTPPPTATTNFIPSTKAAPYSSTQWRTPAVQVSTESSTVASNPDIYKYYYCPHKYSYYCYSFKYDPAWMKKNGQYVYIYPVQIRSRTDEGDLTHKAQVNPPGGQEPNRNRNEQKRTVYDFKSVVTQKRLPLSNRNEYSTSSRNSNPNVNYPENGQLQNHNLNNDYSNPAYFNNNGQNNPSLNPNSVRNPDLYVNPHLSQFSDLNSNVGSINYPQAVVNPNLRNDPRLERPVSFPNLDLQARQLYGYPNQKGDLSKSADLNRKNQDYNPNFRNPVYFYVNPNGNYQDLFGLDNTNRGFLL